MAQSGASSITFAKTFSASSYSKECNSETARLKSFFAFTSQVMSKSTVPNCASDGPHEITSPLFNCNWLIAPFDTDALLFLHDSIITDNKNRGNDFARHFIYH